MGWQKYCKISFSLSSLAFSTSFDIHPRKIYHKKRQLSKKLIKKDRDYLKEKLLTNKYSGRNISHHFWQGGTANDALLTSLELNIVDCSKTSHRGALLCNDRNLHGQVECVISGRFVF